MLTNIEKFLAAVVAALVITTVNIGTNVSVRAVNRLSLDGPKIIEPNQDVPAKPLNQNVPAKPLNQNVPAKPSNKVFFVNLYVYEEQKLINQRTNGQNVLINLYLSYLIQQFLIGIFWKSKALQSISQEFIDQNLGRVLNVTSYKPFKNWEIGLDGFPLRLYNESRQFFNSLFFDKGLDSNIFTLFRIYLEDKLASEPTAEQFIKCIPLQALNLALKENIDKLAHCEIMAEMAEVQAQAKDIRSIFQGVSASPTVDEASVVVSNLIQALDLKIGPRQMSTLLTKRLIQLKEKWGPAYGHKYLIEIEDQKAEGFESLENKRLERRKIEFKKQFLGSKSRSWIHKWACRKKKRIVEDLFTSTKRKNLAKDVHRWMNECSS